MFPRVGLLRSGSIDHALEVIDACRIRWGRVLERDGDAFVANVVPLVMRHGRLVLGDARAERIQAWRDGAGFVGDVEPGDAISIHWSFACDRLSPRQLAGLIATTAHQVRIANDTV